MYIAEGNRQKSEKYMTFLVQAGTFLCFQAGRSSATRSSASDLTVVFFHVLALMGSFSLNVQGRISTLPC